MVWQRIASRFFSTYENAALGTVAATGRDIAFYCCWTRKEALLKALGNGLALPLDSFDVSLDEKRPRLVAVRGDFAGPSTWTLFHLCPAQGYIAALAVEGNNARLVWRSPETMGSEVAATGHANRFDAPTRGPRVRSTSRRSGR